MGKVLPVYRTPQTVYYPDACEPLNAAATQGTVRLAAWGRFQYPGRPLSPKVLPGLNSLGYWDAREDQRWGLDWHRNEGIEFTFLVSGKLTFSVHDSTHELKSGQLTITRPWQPHRVGNPWVRASKLLWLILDVGVRQPHQAWRWPDWIVLAPDDMAELTTLLRQNEQSVWLTDAPIAACFQQIVTCLNAQDNHLPQSELTLRINELLWLLLELFRRGEMPLDASLTHNLRTVRLFLSHLQQEYAYPWTLARMATYCGLGTTSVTKYTKQLTNCTPMNYLVDLRLKAAVRMLTEQPEMRITDVSYACGFSSSQYFSTVFRNRFRCSPNQYRMNKNESSPL